VVYDIFLADCPARTTLSLVADTWSVVVVHALGQGPRRHSDLQERIGGISKKMLTQTLRKLERNGLVEQRRLRSAPPGVEYRLTELGCHTARAGAIAIALGRAAHRRAGGRPVRPGVGHRPVPYAPPPSRS
jgi:DNA-binding HxlR family transcriptional regulator